MPRIVETGLCTDEASSRSLLRLRESGRVQLEPLPRRRGIVAKGLEGQRLDPETLSGEVIGTMRNCLQLGTTEFSRYAPVQPIGPYAGKGILAYRRLWVQLEA
jgi:hypothetical protein